MKQFIALADHINDIYDLHMPPHDETRGFVKIFQKLLSNEEAALALQLTADLESLTTLSARLQRDSKSLSEILDQLSMKGILYSCIKNNQTYYRVLPFVPGILESLLAYSEDPQIAQWLQDYTNEMKASTKPLHEKNIAVNCKIEVQTQHTTLQELDLYLNQTDQYAVMDCLCRSIQKTKGRACGHPIKDMCIITGSYVDYYIKIGSARRVTREEVHQILLYAEEEGLVHEMYPIEKSESIFICNCCICGCMFLELANRIKRILKYDNSVSINSEHCIQCGECINHCPQDVFSWALSDCNIHVDTTNCINCGLCQLVCPAAAITLS